jgi:hypothetical protein
MESETLHNIRTMRQVKTSLEVAGRQKVKTTNSLFKPADEIEALEAIGLSDTQALQVIAREKARAEKFEVSAERARRKLLRSREKLAVVINRNRALTRLRHEIQTERDRQKEAPLLHGPAVKPKNSNYSNLHEIELKY